MSSSLIRVAIFSQASLRAADKSLFLSLHASVAQLVEQGTENPRVIGSIPIGGTTSKVLSFIEKSCKQDFRDEYHSNGAADEARTRYLHLGKVALYQMSYGRIFGAFIPAPSHSYFKRGPAKICEAKFCGEEEEFQSLLRRSYL